MNPCCVNLKLFRLTPLTSAAKFLNNFRFTQHMGSQLLQNTEIIKQTDVSLWKEEYMDLSHIYLAVLTQKLAFSDLSSPLPPYKCLRNIWISLRGFAVFQRWLAFLANSVVHVCLLSLWFFPNQEQKHCKKNHVMFLYLYWTHCLYRFFEGKKN